MSIYKQGKRNTNKQRLEDAYQKYIDRVPGYESIFYKEVIEHAKRKMYDIEIDNPRLGTAGTVDDYAQEVVIEVWQGPSRGSFRGGKSNIYAWVQSIIFKNKKPEFLKEIIDQRKTKVGITTVVEGDDGGLEEIDNPEIYREPEGRDFDIRIPSSVQGIDRLICTLMLDKVRGDNGQYRNRNYANIAMIMEMTENAVKKRMQKLRIRLRAEREAGKKEQQRMDEEADTKRRNSFSIGLAKIRAGKQ